MLIHTKQYCKRARFWNVLVAKFQQKLVILIETHESNSKISVFPHSTPTNWRSLARVPQKVVYKNKRDKSYVVSKNSWNSNVILIRMLFNHHFNAQYFLFDFRRKRCLNQNTWIDLKNGVPFTFFLWKLDLTWQILLAKCFIFLCDDVKLYLLKTKEKIASCAPDEATVRMLDISFENSNCWLNFQRKSVSGIVFSWSKQMSQV